ncbi:MAG: glucose-6-phosphate isomerase, partial [Gammaproteobacteria bacterium]|nr:glucose-6-phosphate isomerase [Gammaproteobacteria bacterium]
MVADSSVPDPSTTPAWTALREHAQHLSSVSLEQLLDGDHDRYSQLSIGVGDQLVADFSRCRVDVTALDLLQQLVTDRHVPDSIERLFAGELVNSTERRAALHTSLRAATAEGPVVAGQDIGAEVRAELERVLDFADAVRSGSRGGHSGERFTRVINIGIGGSDLGPRFVSGALASGAGNAVPDVRYVAGLDGIELAAALADADPHTTLFIVCSKTFGTLETLTNARAARQWLRASLSAEQAVQHFAAVSVNAAAMDDFGVADDARFTLWDWVGGRYSVWSPVGLAAAIALGSDAFQEFLAGGRAMDEHFRSTPPARNLPMLMALMTVWHQNFLGLDQHVVLPYDQRLAGLPDYLQQLWME